MVIRRVFLHVALIAVVLMVASETVSRSSLRLFTLLQKNNYKGPLLIIRPGHFTHVTPYIYTNLYIYTNYVYSLAHIIII